MSIPELRDCTISLWEMEADITVIRNNKARGREGLLSGNIPEFASGDE